MDQRIVIAKLNIEHFQRRLNTELDGSKRQMLLRILAEERAKLAKLESSADGQKDVS